ncbi:hypothetical protein N7456_001284 [Penicillium angulare]|uniref:Uncharacterized protein n=1 Tax=Penicillium angulare TaxID=116970 RepID=A0A9W9GDR1_9EURO|nr:hypothetical protein N7456_001284 [Penicillium angulare]
MPDRRTNPKAKQEVPEAPIDPHAKDMVDQAFAECGFEDYAGTMHVGKISQDTRLQARKERENLVAEQSKQQKEKQKEKQTEKEKEKVKSP